MRQIAFVLHGKIKKQDKIVAAIKAIFGDTANLTFSATNYANHAVKLACDAVLGGATHLICVGGDGSLNEVINGVMLAAQGGWDISKVKIGLLPHGTGNDFARTMGIVNDIGLLKKWIEDDSYRIIDLGHAEFHDPNGKPSIRYFINITDVGIGGTIAMKLSNSSKKLGPTITYQKAILSALFTYKNQPVKVYADSFEYTQSIMSLVVANGRFFGGGMGIAPHALPDDKLFSIVIIGQISTFDYIKNLGNIKKSKKIEHTEIQYLTAAEIRIESPSSALPIDMDGEFIGYAPVKMNIIAGAIQFICPK